jgi:hypothetical protein
MSKYRARRESKQGPDKTALLALIAILIAGVVLLVVARLSATDLATVATSLGTLHLIWRAQRRCAHCGHQGP